MIDLFIDETGDNENPKYFGLCCVSINHAFYANLKQSFHKILTDNNWDPSIEFKGSYLFSASKGCTYIPVDQRVSMCESIIDLNLSEKNARMKISFFRNETLNTKSEYLDYATFFL